MKYKTECFRVAIPLLKKFLYHLAAYRQISATINMLPGEREFWVYTCDAHLENAALIWCMVFGTNSNETHWKKIFDEHDGARSSFLKYLYDKENLSEDDYTEYWNEITAFRDEYVAHKAGYTKPVPSFDMACTVVFRFDEWIRDQINPDIFESPKCIQLFDEYREIINKTLQGII